MVSVTLLPTLPRMRLIAASDDILRTGTLSIRVIRSPGLTPALKAGVSSIGDTTLI